MSSLISLHQYTRAIAAVHKQTSYNNNNILNFETFRSERLTDDRGLLIEEYNPSPWVRKQLTADVKY